jgi:cell division transport system permease protein
MKQASLPPKRRSKAIVTESRNVWLSRHVSVLFFSLGQVLRHPLPSLMTAAVIGIALALPTGLYLLLENVQYVSRDWNRAAQISLFLKPDLQPVEVEQIAEKIYQLPEIDHVRIITPEAALAEYRTLSGFGEAMSVLEENPLPAVLVLQPATSNNHLQSHEALLEHLKQLPAVEMAQFDMLWLKRLFAMVEIVQRAVLILATLLSLAVLLIIGNTIRLSIYNRREEIEIYKLVGATDAFIRRPFLYMGFWYGFAGGFIAWLLVNLSFLLLQGPVKRLTALYYSQFELITLNGFSSFTVLIMGGLLGLGGAWLAVGRHLKDIQPH